jgi:hypothetical protein
MMRLCAANDIRLANDFYRNVCSRCGAIWVPTVNCRVRLLSRASKGIRSAMPPRTRSILVDCLLSGGSGSSGAPPGSMHGSSQYVVSRRPVWKHVNLAQLIQAYACGVCRMVSLFGAGGQTASGPPPVDVCSPPVPGAAGPVDVCYPLSAPAAKTLQDRRLAKLQRILSRGGVGSFVGRTRD